MQRREFLQTAALAAASNLCIGYGLAQQVPPPKPPLPRYRGFNLLHFFQALDSGERGSKKISETDCGMIRDLGFNFVRIPMDYWLWIRSDWRKTGKITIDDMFSIDEAALENVDHTIETANRFGLHVNLNLHRAPGYCVNGQEREPASLWKDKIAQDAFCKHWEVFARRYRAIGNDKLSFNLVNEAPGVWAGKMTREEYCDVMKRGWDTIQKESPDRLVFVDGLNYGNDVLPELVPTGMVQSVHGYTPHEISHYRASWVIGSDRYPVPQWPWKNEKGQIRCDKERLEKHYAPWGKLVGQGVGVHCGEIGCFNKTPHDVMLAWMECTLEILAGHNIGFALWEFRGSFGILDSGRSDVAYEDFHGHKLDHKYAKLLTRY